MLAASFIILASTICLTVLLPSGTLALNAHDRSDGSSPAEAVFEGPQQCGQCHETEYLAWSSTTHAQASFDPIFQVYLQQVEEPGECFACHTTGYDTNSGQFVTAGVTCEACHGPYRPDHPGQSMMIASSDELCGHCHTSTLFEWEASRHGQVGVTCTDCHEVHTQKTRAAASANMLCYSCHQDHTEDATHATHVSAGVACIDCHLARPEDGAEQAVSGHAVTGHAFAVAVRACEQCHSSPLP